MSSGYVSLRGRVGVSVAKRLSLYIAKDNYLIKGVVEHFQITLDLRLGYCIFVVAITTAEADLVGSPAEYNSRIVTLGRSP